VRDDLNQEIEDHHEKARREFREDVAAGVAAAEANRGA
jgi:hypothetical protein